MKKRKKNKLKEDENKRVKDKIASEKGEARMRREVRGR
jgi:hypothetical protein